MPHITAIIAHMTAHVNGFFANLATNDAIASFAASFFAIFSVNWSLLQKGASITQETDRLIFSPDGELNDEFEMLYASLFKKPEPYIRVIKLLAKKKMGMTCLELLAACGFEDNGFFSDILKDLEWCGFIRSYTMMGYKSKLDIYQLIDHYTLFYYEYIDGQKQGSNYWKTMLGTPKYNTWCSLAFERVCLWHVDQIKKRLGISGILTNEYAWRCNRDDSRAQRSVQIDLLIERSDGIIDICEMKYCKEPYVISADDGRELRRKRDVFINVTGTKSAVHTVVVTTEGLVHNEEWGEIRAEITLNDLFEL